MHIYVFNVGSGQNVLIEFQKNIFGIIDFHYFKEQHEPPVLTFLKKKYKDVSITIEFLSISHYHKDHILGLRKFLDWVVERNIYAKKNHKKTGVEIKNIYVSGAKDKTEWKKLFITLLPEFRKSMNDDLLLKLESRMKAYNEDIETLATFIMAWRNPKIARYEEYLSQKLLRDDEKILIWCLAPLNHIVHNFDHNQIELLVYELVGEERAEISENIVSSVLFLDYKSNKLIFGGDIPYKDFKLSLRNLDNHFPNFKYKSKFVLAPHHGSSSSSDKKIWLKILDEKLNVCVAFSAGEKFGHPHEKTISDILVCFEEKNLVNNACLISTNSCNNFIYNNCNRCIDVNKVEVFDYDEFLDESYERDTIDITLRYALEKDTLGYFPSQSKNDVLRITKGAVLNDLAKKTHVNILQPKSLYVNVFDYQEQENQLSKIRIGLSSKLNESQHCRFPNRKAILNFKCKLN
jgi:beta-lactamase superfamily II metal-dependent hydrolase